MQKTKDLEIYIHIPFCIKKCSYCDFLSFPSSSKLQESYLSTLKKEIKAFPYHEEYRVITVFFGGGTPSVLDAKWITEIMELVRSQFHLEPEAEVSLECNPGTVDAEKLSSYRRAGINRLSIGLQSADDRELGLLGRIHTWKDFERTYELARREGFDNINIDLMSALPGQTPDSWEQTIRCVLEKKPEHISAYSLIIEEGTPFYHRYAEDVKRRDRGEQPEYLPSEEEERRMYVRTETLLAEAGMHRYEISNYALPGYECRHNKGYWQGTDYVGFGLGASSLLRGVRCQNTEKMEAYQNDGFLNKKREILSVEEQMEEFMFLGLRMILGVSMADFARRFGKSMDEVYGDVLKRQMELGLLQKKEGQVYLTPRGIDLSNCVMAEFLLSV